MYSSKKGQDMDVDTFIGIVSKNKGVILQLEGGEPLEHEKFLTILDLACVYGCNVVVDTNAVHLQQYIDSIVKLAEYHKKRITIKPSYNNFVKPRQKDLFNIISACEFLENVDFELNVRGYDINEIDELEKEISKHKVKSNSHLFNSYGKLSGKQLPTLESVIKPIYDEWECIASDGTSFGRDLLKRSEYEHIKISTN